MCKIKMRSMAFGTGDTVRLKSGGPPMTVMDPKAIFGKAHVLRCTWFENGILKSAEFPVDALEISILRPVKHIPR